MRININIDTQEEGFVHSDTAKHLRRIADVFDDDNKPAYVDIGKMKVGDVVTAPAVEAVTASAPALPSELSTTIASHLIPDPATNATVPTTHAEPAAPVLPITANVTLDMTAGHTPPATVDDEHAATLDSNGVVWDERINTAARKKTAKGVWKRKPKLDDAFYDSVISELKASAPVTSGVPPITEDTPLPPGDEVNAQELFMEVVRFNMGLNVSADGITNQLAQRLGLENINYLAQADQATVNEYKRIFDQVKGSPDLAQAVATVDMLCPAQS